MKLRVTWSDKHSKPRLNGRLGKYVTSGSSKDVYRVGKYVVKIDRHGEQTYEEAALYKRVLGRDRRFFARHIRRGVIDGVGAYSVQRYIAEDTCCDKKFRKIQDLAERIAWRYNLSDMHNRNFIVSNGKPIIVDYGI